MNAKRVEHCPGCGLVLVQPRSLPDHKRLFSLIAKAFYHWPESHPFKPQSTEHLRGWLIVRAGYVSEEITTFDTAVATAQFPGIPKEAAVQLFEMGLRFGVSSCGSDQSGFRFVERQNGNIVVLQPESLAFDRMGRKKFNEVRSAIEEVIEVETGMTVAQLLAVHIA